MVRLRSSKTDAEATEILDRLINNVWFLGTSVRSDPAPEVFSELLRAYLRDPIKIADFEHRRKIEMFFSPLMPSEEKAEFAQQLATSGNLEFQYQLGEILRGQQSFTEAATWYRRASSGGFVPADLALAEIYSEMAEAATSAKIRQKNRKLSNASKQLAARRIQTSRIELLNSRTRCVVRCTADAVY